MEKYVDAIKIGISAAIGYFLGGWDNMLQLLMIIISVDYITGLLVAGVFKNSNKTQHGGIKTIIGFKGLVRKACIILLVMLVTRLEYTIGDTSFCRNTVIMFFVVNESLSILENMGLMGVKYPDWLKTALEVLNEKKNINR